MTLTIIEKYIEVKTTTKNKETPFFISANEIEFSKSYSSQYYLYRVFDFDWENNKGKFYILKGDISKQLKLTPKQFIASGKIKTNDEEL